MLKTYLQKRDKMSLFKRIFCKKIPFESNKNYIWILKNQTDRDLEKFSKMLIRVKRLKQDLVTNQEITLIPVNRLVVTFENKNDYKSKTQLLKAISKAIENDKLNDIGSIIIHPGFIEITKYFEIKW